MEAGQRDPASLRRSGDAGTLDRDRVPSATNNHRPAAITMPEAANRRLSGSCLSLATLLLGCITVMRHPLCPEPTEWLL